MNARTVMVAIVLGCLIADGAVALAAKEKPGTEVGLKYVYTYGSCTSTAVVDPIDVVWFGGEPTPEGVGATLSKHGFGENDEESVPNKIANLIKASIVDRQYVYTTSAPGCVRDSTQRATGNPVSDRDHVRLFGTTGAHNHLYVAGDAHHDKTVTEVSVTGGKCNNIEVPLPFPFAPIVVSASHISSSFVSARENLAKKWPGTESMQNWKNNRPIRQCNGEYTHSDGKVLFASDVIAGASGFHSRSTTDPAISGTAVVGHTLTATPGEWTGGPTQFKYQWCHIDPNADDCVAITGATSNTYTLRTSDERQFIAVEVRPTQSEASEASLSNTLRVLPPKPFFFRGQDGAIWEATSTGQTRDLGGSATGVPAAVVLSNGERDVYYRGSEGSIWRLYTDPMTEEWHRTNIGGSSAGSPTVSEGNPYSVFFRSATQCIGCIAQDYFAGGAWHTEMIGGSAAGDPTAMADGQRAEQVWWPGSDGAMWEWKSPAPASGGWQVQRAGGTPTNEQPAVVIHADGSESIYFRAREGCISCIDQLYSADGTNWRTEWIGGSAAGVAVAAVAADEGDSQQNVYWRGSNGHIWVWSGNPAAAQWRPEDLGGQAASSPTEIFEPGSVTPVSLYYVEPGGGVADLHWTGGWGITQICSSCAAAP